jgi:hypothetical protein
MNDHVPSGSSAVTPDSASDQLRKELEVAFREYVAAEASFRRITQELPTGMPGPDGTFRIVKAAIERKTAFEKYQDLVFRIKQLSERPKTMEAGS